MHMERTLQPEGCTPTTCIAIAVVEHQGRFLIGQRGEGVPLARLWEFPGGKVELNETPAQAAARECLEETGLAVDVGQEYPPAVHDYAHGRVELHFFACRPRDPSQPLRTPYLWVQRHELANYQFPPANAALLKRLSTEY